MPLTVRVNGKFVGGSPTPNNQVQASWWNDFRDLLTGVMADQPVTIANTLTAQKFIANGTPSSANQIADFQQGFLLFSDNTAAAFAGATSRLWLATAASPGTQEIDIGPRSGANYLAGVRFLTNNVTFSPNGAASPGTFLVAGGMKTSLDTGKITTDGNGGLTTGAVSTLKPASSLYDSLNLGNSHDATYLVALGSADPTFFGGTGLYAYDVKGGGFIFSQGTKNGLTINGALTLGAGGGNVLTASAVGAGYGQIYWHSKDNLTPEFSWTMDSRPAAPLAMQIARQGANGFTFLDLFHIDLNGNISNPAGAGIPTTRNGVATSVPIYTGTNTPVSPPVGAIWIKA